jgi:hypothetical protein
LKTTGLKRFATVCTALLEWRMDAPAKRTGMQRFATLLRFASIADFGLKIEVLQRFATGTQARHETAR